jgi:hypothetical protein
MNNSEAAKKRIGNTPEERSAYMSRIAKQRWLNMTPEQQKALIKKMETCRLMKKK